MEPERRGPEFREERPLYSSEENRPYREQEVIYHTEPTGPAATSFRRDTVRWSSIWAGLVAAIAVVVLMSLIGAAVGLTQIGAGGVFDIGTAAGIWGVITIIVALFVGGWIAASTSAVGGRWNGALHGAMVWALTLVLGLFLSVLGLGAVLGLLGQFGSVAFGDGAGIANLSATAWGTLLGLLLALIAAVAGGFFGAREEVTERL